MYNSHRHGHKRRRSSSSDDGKSKYRRKYDDRKKQSGTNTYSSIKNTPPPNETSGLDDSIFSFENYKQQLNRIVFNDPSNTSIIQDANDFWKFIKKYEDILKKQNKPILASNIEEKSVLNELGVPEEFSKDHCVIFKTKLGLSNFHSSTSYRSDGRHKLTEDIYKQFLVVVTLYLDFKNKEKFNKLKKLRQAQADLPVAKFKNEIIAAVKNERVVVIAGDTGCGKSTQVPQYLSEGGFRSIACTQPRRIACISLAKRVAYESLSQFGAEVGYQIRFEKSKTQDTKICFITEGLLLRQISSESVLSAYDVIILDEIHERHLHGDFLLGVLKCLIQKRRDLKLVLMSATINIKLFEDYFASESAVVIQVPGRLYPIDLNYKPTFIEGKPTKSDRLDPQPYIQIMQLIDSKYKSDEKGDLLIFQSGLKEITTVCEAAQQYADKSHKWIVLPLHSSLSIAEQDKVFDYPPEGVRKCIVSTNIAETSVTIDGIRFVVDCGKAKEMSYDPTCRMQRLKEFWISKASAEQRKGRAGRTGPGVCFRLYSEKEYAALDEFTTPEVSRVPLASLLLLMTSLGMNDVRRFPFLDVPPEESLESAVLELKQHGALTTNEKLTPLGRALSNLPVEVPLAKALVLGAVLLPQGKGDSSLALAAVLGVQSPYTSRAHRDLDCETARKPDESDHGDPLTLLSLYCAWLRVKADNGGGGRGESRAWCRRRGLEEQRFYEVTKLAAQFRGLLQDANLLDQMEPETMSSAERALRHGQLKQLKDLRRQHKQQSASDSRKRKKLKVDSWELVDENTTNQEDAAIDIRDIEFRMTNDAVRMQALISGSSASSGRDLITLKLILCRAIYPQIAVPDEYNHCKSVSEQLYHTASKAFVSLHPFGHFGLSPQILQLQEGDIITELVNGYKNKSPLSSQHQILCYLSLLETNKPYLVNSMRMPAAQTLLLLAHCIDTNAGFTRLVCDSWLLLEFPHPNAGVSMLWKAAKLRQRWDEIIVERLEDTNTNKIQQDTNQPKRSTKTKAQRQFDLACDLSDYMHTNICYTIKRLLPADLKLLYHGVGEDEEGVSRLVEPNPFGEGFDCRAEEKKGGVWITDHIVYNCVVDTDWSYTDYQRISTTPWTCSKCSVSLCLSPLERLQHQQFTCSGLTGNTGEGAGSGSVEMSNKPNAKEYKCDKCEKTLYLTPVEILKHKKGCK